MEIYSEDDYEVNENLLVKECTICGKLFNPVGRNASRMKYCPRTHYSYCEICGAKFELSQEQIRMPSIKTTCSRKCLNAKVIKTTAENLGVSSEGVTNISQIKEVRNKISQSIKDKSDEITTKRQATMLERYGNVSAMQVPELRAKIDATNLARYGDTNPAKSEVVRNKISKKRASTTPSKYCSNVSMNTSQYKRNQDIASKLSQAGIETEFEFYLAGKWYDLHILNTNILIEVDPSYTHSVLPSHWTSQGINPKYHLMKTTIARENGYRCVHLFDWDDLTKVISILRRKQRIHARKCEVKTIDMKLADLFLNDFHLQRSTQGVKVALGLYCNYQLVEVMTFGKPRYNKNCQWELLRLCTLPEYNVIGGASKLFTYFIKKYKPDSVLSYCDAAKFSGDVYEKLGMNLHHMSDPAKVWSRGNSRITDNLLRQRGFDQLFHTNHGKGTSNEQLMIENNWLPVYDCGQYVFTWINKVKGKLK